MGRPDASRAHRRFVKDVLYGLRVFATESIALRYDNSEKEHFVAYWTTSLSESTKSGHWKWDHSYIYIYIYTGIYARATRALASL